MSSESLEKLVDEDERELLRETSDIAFLNESKAQLTVASSTHLDVGKPKIDSTAHMLGLVPIKKGAAGYPYVRRSDGLGLTVGCILDEFTLNCMTYDSDLVVFSPDNCIALLGTNPIDFLFIESTWNGNGVWGNFTKNGPNILRLEQLIAAAKSIEIPIVFWNKEDPVHYDLFKWLVPLVDYTFTSDLNSVDKYYIDFGIRPDCLQFAAQPAIHNPTGAGLRKEAALFAGSYYQKYRERCIDFLRIWQCCDAVELPVDIYDRNYNKPDKVREGYRFPARYRESIKGSLSPENVAEAYKSYLVQINLNTVKCSESMFARRVFESLACGTPVISNYSKAMYDLFGDIVLICDEERDCSLKLQEIINDPVEWKRVSDAGIERVLGQHTYAHRLKQICDLIGVEVDIVESCPFREVL